MHVSEVLDGTSAIITDFIDDIGPVVSELAEYEIECVAYHGEMVAQSRRHTMEKWRSQGYGSDHSVRNGD